MFTELVDEESSPEVLRERLRSKDRFLATVAHELRNPLAPLRNCVTALRSSRLDPACFGAVEILDREIGLLSRLLDDLLELSRSRHGKLDLQPERIDLAVVCRHAVQAVRPACDEKQQELRWTAPEGLLWVEADPVRLQQVLVNLLDNARKFTPVRGRIKLTAHCRRGQAIVTVADNGEGISPQSLPNIFEVFRQDTETYARHHGGLGIGLSLVKEIVERHGGSVTADSAGKGYGSQFTVRLPLAARPESRSVETGASGRGRTLRVLVVDDYPNAAASMAVGLRLMDHTVVTATTGKEALDVAQQFAPELVLLDITLPDLSGYEVARRLRQLAGGEYLVIAAVTGWGGREACPRFAEGWFDAHLSKPISSVSLGLLFEQAANRRS